MFERFRKFLGLGGLTVFVSFAAAASQAADPALTWYGHAAFKYTSASGKVFLIDPWLTNPKAPKNVNVGHVDVILVTHGHSDHVGEAFALAQKNNATFVASYELTEIAQKHGVQNVQPLNPNGSATYGGVTVTAVEAVHSSSYKDGDNLLYAGAPIGFIIQEKGQSTLYHAGDTGIFQGMSLISQMYEPAVAMLPIGGVFTMKPAEAAKAAGLLRARAIIPMHFGTFPALTGTPSELQKELARQAPMSKARELTPGKEIKVKDLLK